MASRYVLSLVCRSLKASLLELQLGVVFAFQVLLMYVEPIV